MRGAVLTARREARGRASGFSTPGIPYMLMSKAKMPAGPFRRRSPNREANMITLSDSVLDDLKTFRGRKADRTIRIEKGSSG